jgi:hypothetical protein
MSAWTCVSMVIWYDGRMAVQTPNTKKETQEMDKKIPVSETALIKRLNRKLHAYDEMLHKTRGGRARQDLGEFYIVNYRTNGAVATHVDIEELAREHGALQPWEALEEETQND